MRLICQFPLWGIELMGHCSVHVIIYSALVLDGLYALELRGVSGRNI